MSVAMDHRTLPQDQIRMTAVMRRDIHDARKFIESRLSDAGFNDISADESFLVGILARNDRSAAGTLLSRLEIPEHEVTHAIDSLALRGYLRPRNSISSQRQPAVMLTERGLATLTRAEYALKASCWADFPLRHGDIVISTPVKCGTTWTQMICALLIFQDANLPAALKELSPWLDDAPYWREAVNSLTAQKHRRFIKSHLPLNELPIDPRVTYIVTARNLLDAALSFYNHEKKNIEHRELAALKARRLPSPRDFLLRWIATDNDVHMPQSNLFPGMLQHLADAWNRRNELNVVLLHYQELATDLEGEMRRVAARLGINVPEKKWPALVRAATFGEMRAAADRIQPEDGLEDSPQDFFHKGVSGAGRELLTDAELAYYHARTAQIAPRDFLTWLHRENKSRAMAPDLQA